MTMYLLSVVSSLEYPLLHLYHYLAMHYWLGDHCFEDGFTGDTAQE